MKIVLINHQGQPELSGVASHFESVAKSLLALGHEVVRITARDRGFTKKNLDIQYHVFLYEKKSDQTKAGNLARIKKNYANFEKTLHRIKWETVDGVITSNDIYLSILKKYISPKRIIAIIPSSLAFSPHSNTKGYLKVIKRIKRNAKGIRLVVLSRKMRSMLTKLLGKKYLISIVPPGVDFKKFSKIPKKRAGDRVLFVGRIADEKNIPALIRSMRHIKKPFLLEIVGTGPLLKEVRSLAKGCGFTKKNISFVGRKIHVEKYYAQAKVFAFPSKYEAFGLVLLEAMASGLPVVAFRPGKNILTASDEIVTNSVDGFLVTSETQMAKKIELLLNDSRLRARMSKSASLRAKKSNWIVHTRHLLQLLGH